MTYPDPRYPQQQPPQWPYPPGGYPNPQQQYPYAQPGYPQPYPQQAQSEQQRNSPRWRAASIAMSVLFRGTYRLGGSARSRVITALMCLGIGLVALVIVVLVGTYLR